jgi:hypothetical protein
MRSRRQMLGDSQLFNFCPNSLCSTWLDKVYLVGQSVFGRTKCIWTVRTNIP